jgi:hypothetical protein
VPAQGARDGRDELAPVSTDQPVRLRRAHVRDNPSGPARVSPPPTLFAICAGFRPSGS